MSSQKDGSVSDSGAPPEGPNLEKTASYQKSDSVPDVTHIEEPTALNEAIKSKRRPIDRAMSAGPSQHRKDTSKYYSDQESYQTPSRFHSDVHNYSFIRPAFLFPSDIALADIETERPSLSRSTSIRSPTLIENDMGASVLSLETSALLKPALAPLTGRQIFLIVTLAVAELVGCSAFACISPFFPYEAKAKGASETQIGVIFGVFEFTMFIMAPLWGKLLPRIGTKPLFCGGLFVTSTCSIMFGLLFLIPAGWPFVIASFLLRIFEATGEAAYITASFAIAAREFPGRVTTIIGILETFSGMGFAIGPTVGGFLYQFGGYSTPFFVIGGLLVVVAIASIFLIKNYAREAVNPDARGIVDMLKTPGVVIMLTAVVLSACSITFIDPTLEPHLEQFNLTPLTVGLMFLCCAATYAVTAPLWGYIVDRTSLGRLFMILGTALACVGLLLVGPSPIFHLQPSLLIIGIGLSLMGLSLGALFIPTFSGLLDVALQKGYPDGFQTYGVVSGLFNSAFSFGGFFGPTAGDMIVEAIGFPWTATIVAGGHLILMCVLLFYFGVMRCNCKLPRMLNYSRLKDSNCHESELTRSLGVVSEVNDSGVFLTPKGYGATTIT